MTNDHNYSNIFVFREESNSSAQVPSLWCLNPAVGQYGWSAPAVRGGLRLQMQSSHAKVLRTDLLLS